MVFLLVRVKLRQWIILKQSVKHAFVNFYQSFFSRMKLIVAMSKIVLNIKNVLIIAVQ